MTVQNDNNLFGRSAGNNNTEKRLSVAVHKFSSCDGCQLAFLNLGEPLLALAERVDIQHFAEAGMVDELAPVDIAFVEGSISTSADKDRIEAIRKNSRYLITIGACATAGGVQALRNVASTQAWTSAIYASPEFIDSLAEVSPIKDYVHVDHEIWGCPINRQQLLSVMRSLLFSVSPVDDSNKVCQECKRLHNVCVMVARGEPCMGPVTRTGCGALCPSLGRDCYACYGPAQNLNTDALAKHFSAARMRSERIRQRFMLITNAAPEFLSEADKWLGHD